MMLKTLQESRLIIDSLPKKIKNSSLKTRAIVKLLDMNQVTFYNRMKRNDFSLNEAIKICEILEFEKKLDKINVQNN